MKKVMIKNIINSLLLVVVLGVSSCNDQLADELFEKRTYLIENGWKDYQLEVDDDNTAILPVYFGINAVPQQAGRGALCACRLSLVQVSCP